MKIILKGATAEITEKKSRFIATVQSVRSQEEADDFILRTRKTFWDARHNCSAMILGQRGEISRCSDDGEPSGTAGRPMLSVLAGEELTDVYAQDYYSIDMVKAYEGELVIDAEAQEFLLVE